MADVDRCICCGEIVPEGRMVCPQCEYGVHTSQVQTSSKRENTIKDFDEWINFFKAYPEKFYERFFGIKLSFSQKLCFHAISRLEKIKHWRENK